MTRPHGANRRKLRLLGPGARISARLARPLARLLRESPGTPERLARFGLEPVDVVEAPVDRLLVQRPVRCELIPSREATTLDFLDAYMVDESGRPDWRISRSMQHRLLEAHAAGELPDDLSATDYWQWHVSLREAGINERPDAMIARKLRGLIEIHDSMRERGYDYGGGLRGYVWVLEEPLIHSRYGIEHGPEGLEVFDGHHRAAAAACLGYDELHVLLLRDVGRTTGFGVPLDEVAVPVR